MKKILTLLVFISGNIISFSQNGTGWFTTSQPGNGVTVIADHNNADNMYLVQGSDSAMLIDTGLGNADLSKFVRKLSSKPLIVINTHAHPDHSGSNYQFEKVFIHPADSEAARSYNTNAGKGNSSNAMSGGDKPAENEVFSGRPFNTRLVPVYEGKIFDLGGRTIQVIEAPGHTPGEICLLDRENKLLFTGDNSNTLVWLFLQNSRPLKEYLTTLEKLEKRMHEDEMIFPGHGTPLPADFIRDQVSCVRGILDHSLEAKPYESFAGNAMVSVWGRASVTFNPGNL
ncbi:MAG: MBL fold metallo-hydrolase [Bacteroidales bacterium]